MRAAIAARIGCAGWSIGRAHAPLFGPGASQLARYATRLDSVEINSSFYRPHRRQTYERWADTVPPGFRFSVKLPRAITHEARLVRCGAQLDAFAGQVAGLGEKLAGVLVQLPPSLAYDAPVAGRFFAALRRRLPVAVACEPRHASWADPSVEALWRRHRIARVAADPPPFAGADEPSGDGDWTYWRWHGSPRRYFSAYSSDDLDRLAELARHQTRPGRMAWLVFDNTAHGHATTDALALRGRLVPGARRKGDAGA
jgi:uncharacterized protein YecE (DUF72 family)